MKSSIRHLPLCCSALPKSRLTAAFVRHALALAIGGGLFTLSGCSVIENSPAGRAVALLSPSSGQATAEQAESIAFASLSITTSTQRGLVVLGAQGGEQTHWPMAESGFLSLYQGGLYAAATAQGDLLATRYSLANEVSARMPWQLNSPAVFSIERHWVDQAGLSHAQRAKGRMLCGPAEQRSLLLTALSLQPCQATYAWDNGQITQVLWWRDPATLRLWEVEEQAWPQGPEISWQVARPWWDSE